MRVISWIKAAQKVFEKFPLEARQKVIRTLKIAAQGQKADIAKPMKVSGPESMKSCYGTKAVLIASSMPCR